MRAVKIFCVCVMFTFINPALFAMTLFTDQSYYPALKNEINQSKREINAWISCINIEGQSSGPVLGLLDALEQASLRGVAVTLNIPSGAIPPKFIKEMHTTGINVLRYEERYPQTRISIDDKVFLGSHRWTSSGMQSEHAISILLDKTEKFQQLEEKKIDRSLLKQMERSEHYLVLAINRMDVYSADFKEKLFNLLENKQLNKIPVSVLFDQSSIQPYSIIDLFSAKGNNIPEAQALIRKKVPVFLDNFDSNFNFQLFLLDSVVILGVEPDKLQASSMHRCYVRFDSLELGLILRHYLDSLPVLSVQDIVKYN